MRCFIAISDQQRMRHDWLAPRVGKRKVDQISLPCRRVEISHVGRRQRSYLSPRVRSLGSSTPAQASHTSCDFHVITFSVLMRTSFGLPFAFLQTRRPRNGPSSLKPQISLRTSMLPPRPVASRLSRIIWTPICTSLVSCRPPKRLRARLKLRLPSSVSSN